MSYSGGDRVVFRNDETKTEYMVTCVHRWGLRDETVDLSLHGRKAGDTVSAYDVFPANGHNCTEGDDCYCEGGDTNLDANTPHERCYGRGCFQCDYTGMEQ
mgnify:CR=1 FL=1